MESMVCHDPKVEFQSRKKTIPRKETNKIIKKKKKKATIETKYVGTINTPSLCHFIKKQTETE
jgi:hypothetical protein